MQQEQEDIIPVKEEKTQQVQKLTWLEKLQPRHLFSYGNIVGNLPFMLFLSLLAVIYIWNRHDAERNSREMGRIQKELVEYNWEFTSTKSELNNKSKQSEVSEMVKPLGLQELIAPPYKIVVDKDEY